MTRWMTGASLIRTDRTVISLRRDLFPRIDLVTATGTPPFVDDVPGSLSDGMTWFYLIDERGAQPPTITVEARPDPG